MLFGQQKSGIIYGKITDDNAKPLELVNICILGGSHGVSSDSRGQYTLTLPADTTLEIVYLFVGYEQQKKTIILKEGEHRKVDIVLT